MVDIHEIVKAIDDLDNRSLEKSSRDEMLRRVLLEIVNRLVKNGAWSDGGRNEP
jgi:hypothetical protein